jgi:hypothetical protein
MPTPLGRKERQGLIRRFASRLSFPKLFFVLTALFILDFFIVDPLPFVDEAILGILAVMVGMWRGKRDQKGVKDVTPLSE